MISILSLSLLVAAIIAAGRKMALSLERQAERDDHDALLAEALDTPIDTPAPPPNPGANLWRHVNG